MLCGNGGLFRCTISNPKYPRGPGGFESPPPWFNGWLTNFLFTSIGKSSCKFTNYVPLGVCGLDLILLIVVTGVNTNGTSVIVSIDWGIAMEYNGTNLIGSFLKFEVLA